MSQFGRVAEKKMPSECKYLTAGHRSYQASALHARVLNTETGVVEHKWSRNKTFSSGEDFNLIRVWNHIDSIVRGFTFNESPNQSSPNNHGPKVAFPLLCISRYLLLAALNLPCHTQQSVITLSCHSAASTHCSYTNDNFMQMTFDPHYISVVFIQMHWVTEVQQACSEWTG